MKKNTKQGINKKVFIISAVLGLLVLLSGIQAFELAELKGKINSELNDLSAFSSTNNTKNTKTSSASTLQNNLDNLPSMVGGC